LRTSSYSRVKLEVHFRVNICYLGLFRADHVPVSRRLAGNLCDVVDQSLSPSFGETFCKLFFPAHEEDLNKNLAIVIVDIGYPNAYLSTTRKVFLLLSPTPMQQQTKNALHSEETRTKLDLTGYLVMSKNRTIALNPIEHKEI
jgi:hypothetical protein